MLIFLFDLHENKCLKVFDQVVILWVPYYFLFGNSSRYGAVNYVNSLIDIMIRNRMILSA